MKRTLLLWLILGSSCSSGSDEPRTEDCARLRDHSIELRMASVPRPPGTAAAEVERHRSLLTTAAGTEYIEQCKRYRSPEEVRCALEAQTLDALQACLPAVANQ